jgi:hypothetical protein
VKHLLLLATLAGFLTLQAHGQMIQVRTYPILSQDSFTDLPSENRSMGRMHTALRDSLGEGFSNPAMLGRGKANYLFALPQIGFWKKSERIESRNGATVIVDEASDRAANMSVPVGGVMKCSGFAVAAVAGLEELSSSHMTVRSGESAHDERVHGSNYPFHLGASWEIPGTDVVIGASGTYVSVHGIDGIQFLYPSPSGASVSGSTYDMRLGAAATIGAGELSAVTGHEVAKDLQTILHAHAESEYHQEISDTWFAQAGYRIAVNDQLGLGFEATGNWRRHPEFVDYPVVGSPQKAGTTQAYNFSAGMNWRSGQTTFALEYVLEPIRSNTSVLSVRNWLRTINDTILRVGELEQQNKFTFLNHVVRGGVKLEPAPWLAVRLGTEVRFNSLAYENVNYVDNNNTTMSPANAWTEVSFSGGLDATFGRLRLIYEGEVLTGRGLIDRGFSPWLNDANVLKGADFLLVPTAGVTVSPVPVFTNRFTIMYALD